MFLAKSKLVAGLAAALAIAGATGARARQGVEDGPAPAPAQEVAGRKILPRDPVLIAERDAMTAYPIEIRPDKVYDLPGLSIKFREFQLDAGPVSVIPIDCERGITGAVILGRGTFRHKPEDAPGISGEFRAAMLRFHPEDLPSILPLDAKARVTDRGSFELGRDLIDAVFGHCWHSGKKALIPPRGTIAAVVYSKEHGDVLVSDDGKTSVIHNFSDRKTLYEKK